MAIETVTAVAVATVTRGADLPDVLGTFGDQGPEIELTVDHRYSASGASGFRSCPTRMQDIPLRPTCPRGSRRL